MSKKTMVLQFIFMALAWLALFDLAEGFYIRACVREFGYYMENAAHCIACNLLGFLAGYSLLGAYLRSLWGDLERKHCEGRTSALLAARELARKEGGGE